MMIAVAILALLMGGGIAGFMVIPAGQAWLSRRRGERLGGRLLLRVIRPWLRQLEAVVLVLYAFVLMALLGFLLRDVATTWGRTSASEVVNNAFPIFLTCTCIGLLYLPCFRWARLELREHGVIYECQFWQWESIREWNWKDGGDTLRLKVPHRIMWYAIDRKDKESVQAILEQHFGFVGHRAIGA
jgi:hypothetical protein